MDVGAQRDPEQTSALHWLNRRFNSIFPALKEFGPAEGAERLLLQLGRRFIRDSCHSTINDSFGTARESPCCSSPQTPAKHSSLEKHREVYDSLTSAEPLLPTLTNELDSLLPLC